MLRFCFGIKIMITLTNSLSCKQNDRTKILTKLIPANFRRLDRGLKNDLIPIHFHPHHPLHDSHSVQRK